MKPIKIIGIEKMMIRIKDIRKFKFLSIKNIIFNNEFLK